MRQRLVVTADGRIGGILHEPTTAVPDAPLIGCIHGSGCTSRYFDLSTNSLVAEAVARGFPVLLLDRPGHGVSFPPLSGSAIEGSADALGALIAAVTMPNFDLAQRPIALIGHSFGGAVALAYAARPQEPPLLALCVSGIGDLPNPAYAAARAETVKPSPNWLFGPGSTYDWRGVTALRTAMAAWRPDEIDEITTVWPRRWAAVTASITCPVQLRLAEFERIWDPAPHALNRMASAFQRAKQIDAAVMPEGGHLYEAHLRGSELIAAQIGFIADAANRARLRS